MPLKPNQPIKLVANQRECKVLVAENCKSSEIFRMCQVYGEACVSKKKKMFTSGLKIGLL